jgi:hypothetical protein
VTVLLPLMLVLHTGDTLTLELTLAEGVVDTEGVSLLLRPADLEGLPVTVGLMLMRGLTELLPDTVFVALAFTERELLTD